MKKTIMGAMVALTMLSGQALAAGDVAAGQAKAGVQSGSTHRWSCRSDASASESTVRRRYRKLSSVLRKLEVSTGITQIKI